jgi:hypothetical protein
MKTNHRAIFLKQAEVIYQYPTEFCTIPANAKNKIPKCKLA